jgi:hypothetical protein
MFRLLPLERREREREREREKSERETETERGRNKKLVHITIILSLLPPLPPSLPLTLSSSFPPCLLSNKHTQAERESTNAVGEEVSSIEV